MALSPGTTLGTFEIVGVLGKGGMGEVYRATDLKLGRDVAIKVLPEVVAGDPEHLGRFRKEAKTLASLDHPNIGAVYDFHDIDGVHFLVMQLVEGDTLSDRIRQGRMSVREALPIFVQIARGLDAAHEAGIVHRDLKPANVKISPRGEVKVLDFGIAKDVTAAPLDPNAPTTPMTSSPVTGAGLLVGTPQYMSPEQARGKPVDRRTDIWAFGCCLYEALSGIRPYDGETMTDVVTSIVRDDPEWSRLPPDTPAALERLLRRCLEKGAPRRLSSASDIAIALEDIENDVRAGSASRRISGDGGERPADKPHRGVVVLPFENLMGDSAQEYFVDGMTDALSAELSKIKALRVISRSSAMRYKGSAMPLRQIARELDVDTVVEGSIFRSGNDIRITAQVVNAITDEHLWGDSFDGRLDGILTLQREVALAIAKQMQVRVTPEEVERIESVEEVPPEIYERFLMTQAKSLEGSPASITQAVGELASINMAAPNFAQAYVQRARVLYVGSIAGVWPCRDRLDEIREAAQAAVRCAPEDGNANAAMGYAAMVARQWDASRDHFERAVELDSNATDPWHGLAWLAAFEGKEQECFRHGRHALSLDPMSSVSEHLLGIFLFLFRHYDESFEHLNRALELQPGRLPVMQDLSMVQALRGDTAGAIAIMEELIALTGPRPQAQSLLALYHTMAGRKKEAQRYVDAVIAQKDTAYFARCFLASALGRLGRRDEAFDWLERAREEYEWFFSCSLIELTDPLRTDPRLDDVLARGNIPERVRAKSIALGKQYEARMLAERESRRAERRKRLVPVAVGVVFAAIGIVALAASYWNSGEGAPPLGAADRQIASLAVLPFDNLMGDESKAYFVDGMTDTLTAELSKIGSIKVIARTSAMRFKGSDKPPSQIARELGVHGLVEGSVQQFGDEIRITAQLIDGRSEAHLWGENFEGTIEGVLRLQGEVAVSIADQIGATLTPDERDEYATAKVVNPEAFDLYLRGRDLMQSRLGGDLRDALSLFKEAIAIDSEFALAYSGLADVYNVLSLYTEATTEEVKDEAYAHARRAIALEPDLADAHASLGWAIARFDAHNNWAEAEHAFQRAIALNPGLARARRWYASYLSIIGRSEEAVKEARIAFDLDPLDPLVAFNLGHALYSDGQLEESERMLLRALELDPDLPVANSQLSKVYKDTGRIEAAVDRARVVFELTGNPRDEWELLFLSAVNEGDAALKALAAEVAQGVHESRIGIGGIELYFALGDTAAALDAMGRTMEAYENGVAGFRSLQSVHTFDGDPKDWRHLHDEPDFWEILDPYNLPPLAPGHPRYAAEQRHLRRKAMKEVLAARGVRRFSIPLGPEETLKRSELRDYSVSVSRDGSHVAYVAWRDGVARLMLRPIDQLASIELPGTEGAAQPAFSPDGQSICFFADGYLMRTAIHRGVPERIFPVNRPMGLTWVDGRRVIFSSNVRSPLRLLDLDSRAVEDVLDIEPAEGVHVMPHMLPGGKGLLFVSASAPTLDHSNVELYVFETGERRVLLRAATRPHYLASGHIVAAQQGRFTALPFDLRSLRVTGGPVQVGSEVELETPLDFGISEDGMLVLSTRSGAESRDRDLVWVDETGLEERVDAPSLPYFRVRISPDGTHAAIDMTDFENIYVLNLERGGTPRLLTFADESGFFPIWSPDGRDLIYTNRDDAEAGLARKNIDGIGPARTFVSRVELIFPWTVTSDGATLLATSFGAETTGLDLFTVSLNEPHEFDLLIDDPGSQAEATLSPDGKWLAYSSNETGVTEIYVRPYPSLAGKWQVSTGYGLGPRWDRDGKRLYYRSSDSMMAVDIEATASSFVAGEPRELFRTPYHDNATNSAYDRSPIDGRFLMIKLHTRSGESDELMVVDNWTTEIARLAPAADR